MVMTTDEVAEITIVKPKNLLLVVDIELSPSLDNVIDQYVYDLSNMGCTVNIFYWQNGTALDLKDILINYYEEKNIDGAFFIGDLPTSWYELWGFGQQEEFPCDLFFMDLDAEWQDTDNDGIFDYHSTLGLDIYVSRIAGTSKELEQYFEKVHMYRMNELNLDGGAYIFKDNDWASFNKGSNFELDKIFNSIKIVESLTDSIRPNYISELTNSGATFIYQWIHSYPPILAIEDQGTYEYLNTIDITSYNFKGLFFNLFNCSASRFTEENIAMSYLVKTNYGLATIGSTKVGANYYPDVFHKVLSENGTWGEAFKAWYNTFGITDDKWFMGMVILGDPTLVVSKGRVKDFKSLAMALFPPVTEEVEELNNKIIEFTYDFSGGTFDEYVSQNPQFFQE